MNTSNTTTALYVRVSTADQRPDSQVVELEFCCRARGYSHLRHFVEKESGAKVTRPQLDALMAEVRSGKVARVVVYKLDRLGRSLTHLALILDELQRLGVSLICTSQGIDTSGDNPAGRLQLGVLMAVAEFERSLIRERVNAGLRAAKGRGVKLGRPSTLAGRRAEILQLQKAGVGFAGVRQKAALASILSGQGAQTGQSHGKHYNNSTARVAGCARGLFGFWGQHMTQAHQGKLVVASGD